MHLAGTFFVNVIRGAVITAALAAGAMLASAASAQSPPSAERVRGGMFDASDPPALSRFMERIGYRVQLRADERGDPQIFGRMHNSDFVMQFYECENGAFCNSVQLLVQAVRPQTATLEALNAFNARWRYARATIAGDQLRLQMDLNLDAGVTADNLEDTLDIWYQLVKIFEGEMLGRS